MKLCIFILLLPAIVSAQNSQLPEIENVLNKVNSIINVSPGQERNPEALREYFMPNAKFTVHMHSSAFPSPVESIGLDEFIELLKDEYYEQGYEERITGHTVEEYNGIAHAFQSFYAKDSEGEEVNGLSSYQLVYLEGKWRIVSILWTDDSNGKPVPEKFVKRE